MEEKVLSSRTFPLAPVKAAFRLVSQTNLRAQREILRAVLANNPSFALLNDGAAGISSLQEGSNGPTELRKSADHQRSTTLRLPKKTL